MTNKRYFLFVWILIFIGLVGVSCFVYSENYPIVTLTPVSVKLPTDISTQTAIPTSTPLIPIFPPYPTSMPPYPTASVVKSNVVAFIGYDKYYNNSLWVANLDGSGERKLTDITKKDSQISVLMQWSPSGQWISYRSDDDLWMISHDGSVKRKLISFPDKNIGQLYTYVWSPDSSQIAYIQTANPWAAVSQIIVGILDLETGKVSEVSSHEAPDPKPISWSPDGKYLLFAKDFSYSLYEVATGKITKEIKPNGEGCWVGWSIWSPNGKWFFDTEHGNGRYSYNWICVSGLDDSNRQINVDGTTSTPVWDKTGNLLYFTARKTNPNSIPNLKIDERLMRYNVKTQKIETLLLLREQQTDSYVQSVSISPDKRTLLLQSQFSKTKFDLIFVDIQSLTTTKFTVDFTDLKIPLAYAYFLDTAWSSDSQNIILLAGDVCSPHACIEYYGSFYTLNVETGKTNIFSGNHVVDRWAASPIVTSP